MTSEYGKDSKNHGCMLTKIMQSLPEKPHHKNPATMEAPGGFFELNSSGHRRVVVASFAGSNPGELRSRGGWMVS